MVAKQGYSVHMWFGSIYCSYSVYPLDHSLQGRFVMTVRLSDKLRRAKCLQGLVFVHLRMSGPFWGEAWQF